MEDRLERTEANTRNFSHSDGEDQCFGTSDNPSWGWIQGFQLHCCVPAMANTFHSGKLFPWTHWDLINRVSEDQFSHLQRKLSKQSPKWWTSRFICIKGNINIDPVAQVPLERAEQMLLWNCYLDQVHWLICFSQLYPDIGRWVYLCCIPDGSIQTK